MGVDTILSAAQEYFPAPATDHDVGGSGLRDCFCDGDGLDLCTESLGSESCECRLDPQEEEALLEGTAWAADKEHDHYDDSCRWLCRSREPKKTTTEFPPPLRWMAEADGRRTGIIRSERRNGRLVLTEVRIERPEVFRATREDGRLKLQAVESDEDEEEPPEEEEEEEEAEWRDQWQRGGEGFRRCQDPANSNHVEVPAWWNHRMVTMA